MPDWVYAVILGVIEGLTEFIPVSSTGMMLLAKHGMGLTDPFWNTFAVMIQLGAILAVVVLYFGKLWRAVITLPSDPASRHFALTVIVAFIPSIVLGLLLHDFIKGVLFDSPTVQCISLIIGGVVLLLIDRRAPAPVHREPDQLPLKTAFIIGLFQVLAMIPGVSRSGATIVGGMLNKVEKRAAAEFTFFLAIPTMLGAFVLDAVESRDQLMAGENLSLLAIGFVTAFVVAVVVIKLMLAIVTRRGFAPFGWLRIAIGAVGLAALQFA
ncbi:undecaprenyl-diphosphate phosphatase [Phenylobacterium sp.]|uniref:undecaprenyl-diphosphate phosphatase n=1 Tax=Phenylobacterium sp. TaxID=1871053 RepID=UPI002CB0C3EF|nr:undecaprenyl-diphosphate phosphatase [Phenylobacterium sp.]HVI31538.1 undecaprenyl-diphosphate phosphatase [Phenylobacterium sp.]